jgi:two-component system cell cycle response regulator
MTRPRWDSKVTLAHAIGATDPPRGDRRRPTAPPPGPQRILVVEDEQIVAFDLLQTLEALGYIVVGTAASSDEACAMAREGHPDLVLMDVRLEGDVDGIQTGALIRKEHQVPIVYLTGNADDATLARALETEPEGYLAKPFDPATLRATIEVALRRHTAQMTAHSVNSRLRREATSDPLTGLYNRRGLDAALAEQFARAERTDDPFGVILLDLDHFKRINDSYGHLAGDTVLHEVAQFLRTSLRASDVACRYGGEELAIIAPGLSLIELATLAERLRAGVASLSISLSGHLSGTALSVTASFGIAAFPEHGLDAGSLLRAADDAVYAAKRAGRNQVAGPRR